MPVLLIIINDVFFIFSFIININSFYNKCVEIILVQNMGGKALAKDCNLPGDYCTAFGGCCPGYYCSRDKNTCVECKFNFSLP